MINNDISVLFYNSDTYKKYKSAEDFIDDCRKNKWGRFGYLCSRFFFLQQKVLCL